VRIKSPEDGVLVLNQSAIGAYIKCPEQFRVGAGVQPGGDLLGNPESRIETDAATCGTVLHTVIEHDLSGTRFTRKADIQTFAKREMSDTLAEYNRKGVPYIQSSFGTNPTAIYGKLQKLVEMWFYSDERKYWLEITAHHPECFDFEWEFETDFMIRPGKRYHTIRVAGTADVLDRYNHRLVDWKSSSRDKQPWEETRWNIQSTMYTYAAANVAGLETHDDGYWFDLRVFNHKNNNSEPQGIRIVRTANNWAWLIEIVSQMVSMIESDLEVWPYDDTHALCSPKWCFNWADCKGRYIEEGKWS
jgi:hypothetical protein